ncbi:hypothetical protein [Sinimarinibacterium sp. CAU 1509]|uniref:hypothetical protein n=1 Tax=Sinimarinibacterium sp. CAU 1509 TaxID=2562283 RepID=UPI001B7F9957|nr:hypothetical protein [Sinimarinibacterium sp. CAU 1509]
MKSKAQTLASATSATSAAGAAVVLEIRDRLPQVFEASRWLPKARETADYSVRFIVRSAGWITAEHLAVETSAVHI